MSTFGHEYFNLVHTYKITSCMLFIFVYFYCRNLILNFLFSITDLINYLRQKAIKYHQQSINISSRTWWDSMRAERIMYETVERSWQSLMTCHEKDDIDIFFEKVHNYIDQQKYSLRLAYKSKTIN